MKTSALILTLFITSTSFCQYIKDFSKVVEADTIVYYGFDFSMFRLINPDKVGTESTVEEYFSAWIKYFESKKDMNYYGHEYFKKPIKRVTNEMQSRQSMLPSMWITYDPHKLKLVEIQELIKSYQLSETSGIGYVAIVENFEKEEEQSRVCHVLFDIETREVLFAGVAHGFASRRAGMTRHWGSSIVKSFDSFLSMYNKEYRRAK